MRRSMAATARWRSRAAISATASRGSISSAGDRLYLFYSTANRDAFGLAEAEAARKAAANWPKLSATLIAEQSP